MPKQLLDVLKDSSGQTWFANNLENIDWSKENYDSKNTIGILEKDVKSFLDAVNETSPNNKAMKKFQNSLIEGLKGIPSYPN